MKTLTQTKLPRRRPFLHWVGTGSFLSVATVVATVRAPLPSVAQTGVNEYAQGLQWAQQVAVPPDLRPRRFIIADYLIGPGPDAQALDNGLQTLSLLGINTAEVKGFGNLQAQVWQKARTYGITRTLRAIYEPTGPKAKYPGQYYSWNTEDLSPSAIEAWGRDQAAQISLLGADPGNVALFHMADEPGWYYPDITQKMVATPERLEKFRSWLRAKGLSPADLGASSWSGVRPVTLSEATDLPKRRLYYWTARYPTESAAEAFHVWSSTLKKYLNPQVMVTSNWNNAISRFYMPSPNMKWGKNTDTGPDAAMGSMDWMDAGRKRAVSTLWGEDWFADIDAETWSYNADALNSAARLGSDNNTQTEFGGFIVGNRLGDIPSGGRYKALALIGHGAKAIEWYVWGPNSIFKGNSYSGNQAAYASIAGANRLIGRAEDLLYPGRRAPARIAILLGTSAQVWDTSPNLPLYQYEMKGIHYALTHTQYPVDFMDETQIAGGGLNNQNINILYVTAPNVSAAAQNAIRDWVTAGGTAIFSPGAAAADEYNTPTSTLNSVRGVRAVVGGRPTVRDVSNVKGSVTFQDNDWGQTAGVTRDLRPLDIAGATSVASVNGQPAVAVNHAGRGLAVSYGFWPGCGYIDSGRRNDPHRLLYNWNVALRNTLVAAPRLTNSVRPVELSAEGVEAARLDSSQGVAVTLLNWTQQPLDALNVTIRNAGAVRSVGSAEKGTLNFTRNGNSIRVTLPVNDVDVLLLRY